MTRPQSDRLHDVVASIPPAPASLARIWAAGDDQLELEKAVTASRRLSRQILRLGSSDYFGIGEPIDTVPEAVRLLGTEAVQNLSAILIIKTLLWPQHPAPPGFDRLDFWRRSIATGIAAERVAHQKVTLPDFFFEAFFAAGILHDLGVMVLDVAAPDALAQVMRQVDRGVSILDAERQILGSTHAEIGQVTATAWSLPPRLVEPIAHHHDPLRAPAEHQLITCAVHVASALTAVPSRGYGGSDPPDNVGPVLEAIRIDTSAAREAATTGLRKLPEVEALLELPAA